MDKFVTSNGASPASNASASLASNDTAFDVTTVLGDGISTRKTVTDSAEGAANGARSTAAARWGELTSRVIPPRSGLVLHLDSKLGQDVGRQLSISVGLGNVITELGLVIAIVDQGRVFVRNWGLVTGNDRAASGVVVRRCGMRVLAPLKELRDSRVGLGPTWSLLRMSVGNTVLVSWERGDVMSKLITSGRGSRSGGLAGFDHIDGSGADDFLHIFR